jgi:SAM-dependent methyltransferase
MGWSAKRHGSARQFQWISSVTGDPARLAALSQALEDFYSRPATRQAYQAMIDDAENAQPQTRAELVQAVLARRPAAVLEVGCGSGHICRLLRQAGYQGRYTGLEMSAEVIGVNRQQHPQEEWVCGSVYTAPFAPGSFDVAFSCFVLEHCVYPARVLDNMLGWTGPNGAVLLVFPDFVAMGRLASQPLGFVEGNAGELLRKGDLLNALFNLYEARVRLRRALKMAVQQVGPFPVNTQPRCLRPISKLTPDVDAVYIASKNEIQSWAEGQGLAVRYPAGTDGNFRENALIELLKRNGRP